MGNYILTIFVNFGRFVASVISILGTPNWNVHVLAENNILPKPDFCIDLVDLIRINEKS